MAATISGDARPAASPFSEKPQPHRPVAVTVRTEPAYVPGLPMPMAMVVTVVRRGVVLDPLLEPDPFDLGDGVGVTLLEAGATSPLVHAIPSGVPDLAPGAVLPRLGYPDSRRWLIDLAPAVPRDLPPGRYTLMLSYVGPTVCQVSEPLDLVLRAPDEAEQAFLAAHAAALRIAGGWGLWARTALAPDEPLPDPAAAPPLARFLVAARRLAFDPTPLTELDPQILDAVTGVARAEALTIAAELFHLGRDEAAWGQLRDAIIATYPGLGWRLAAIDAGHGFAASLH